MATSGRVDLYKSVSELHTVHVCTALEYL